jgi:intracellular septation protein
MKPHTQALINWSIEFGPIILFFLTLFAVGDSKSGFITATTVFTAATFISLVFAYIREKRIALFVVVAGIFIIAFGLGTILFADPRIFIIKDSIYNGFFAVFLLIGILRGRGYLKLFFSRLFDISDEGWRILSLRWMIMFTALVISNELVWRLYSQNTWVVYKLIATIVTIGFGMYQFFLAKKFRNETASAWGMRTGADL